jgi:hypothetical protein
MCCCLTLKGKLRPEDEQEYVQFCSNTIFRIKVLEQVGGLNASYTHGFKRLELHKEQAPQKYIKLDHTLRSDKRLAHLLK